MIYIDRSKTNVQVFVPVNGDSVLGTGATIVAKAQQAADITLEVSTPRLIPSSGSALVLEGKVTVPQDLALGEYDYELTMGPANAKKVCSRGLLVVWEKDEPVGVKEYNETITYKEYEG